MMIKVSIEPSENARGGRRQMKEKSINCYCTALCVYIKSLKEDEGFN
jgi:hypothetical protein